MGDSNPQMSPVLAMLDPSPSLGVQGRCHQHGVPEGTLPPHTLHCARVGTHSRPLPWYQRQSQIYTPGSSQSNKGFILTEPVPVSLSRPRAHRGWIRAEPTPKPVVPWGAAKHPWVLHPWKLGGFIGAALKPAMGTGEGSHRVSPTRTQPPLAQDSRDTGGDTEVLA